MCMIAHRYLSKKGKGQNIPNAVIDTALTRHPDGFGIAWRDPERGLLYEKFGPDEKQLFRTFLKEIDAAKDIEYVAHFRFATHGPEDEAHAHPFAYNDPDPEVGEVLVFHNGIIADVETKITESDTEVFVREYIAMLPSRWWDNTGIRRLVANMAGWSKLVLMTKDETINLNHWSGEDDGGLWYSSDHRPYRYTSTGYSTNKGWTSYADDDEEPGGAVGSIYALGATTYPRTNSQTFMHHGHKLTPFQTFDFTKDGDYECSVLCEVCGTAGDVYIVDGKAYVDIPHGKLDKSDGLLTAVIEVEETSLVPYSLLS